MKRCKFFHSVMMVFREEKLDKTSVCVTLSSNEIDALFSVRDFEMAISPVHSWIH
jgi:hypothetical protein